MKSLESTPSPLLALQTLKGEEIAFQIGMIKELSRRLTKIYDVFSELISTEYADSIFKILITDDRERVIATILLSVVAADITTVPDRAERHRYRSKLDEVCSAFSISYSDINRVLKYITYIENHLGSD